MGLLDKLNRRITEVWDDLTLPEQTREELERAERALEGGTSAEQAAAVAALELLTAQHPDLLRAWTLLGLAQQRRGDLAGAQASLARACELKPSAASLKVSLAEVQRAAGERSAAIKSYKQALGQRVDQPLLAQIFGGLGGLYLEGGDADHAVRELRKAAALTGGADLELLGQLGLAQKQVGTLEMARVSLERGAAAPSPRREVLLALAGVLVELGQPGEARLAALRLLELNGRDVAGRCALARALLAAGEPAAAREELLRALEVEPRSVTAHRLLGAVYRAAQDPAGALVHLRAAEEHLPAGEEAARLELLRELLELELEQPAHPELGQDAARLLALAPDDPLALACSAVAQLGAPAADPAGSGEAGDPSALLERAAARGESYPARLGLGLLHLRRGEADQAVAHLRAAMKLRPASKQARALLEQAFAAQVDLDPQGGEPRELYPLLGRIRALMGSHPALTALSAPAAQIEEIHDRPLLVTVMGEFNSGKSTFINAFIGERIAPMGVTPTTATINVLKYGAHRSARVIWRDHRQQNLSWSQVGDFLARLDDQQAREIKVVELLYPAEELLRVNVVDTPGLNSVLDAHEQTARHFMAQADAVIWLFSGLGAGRQSEEQALELLGQHRLKTVGVINKIDRLSAEEQAQVQAHLEAHFSPLVEAIIPVSAKEGLEALEREGLTGLEQSRFPELCSFLERRLFSHSLSIKNEVCSKRASELLARAETVASGMLREAERRLEALDQGAARVSDALPPKLVGDECGRLAADLDRVYRQGAQEVLDFVRPRSWALGSHEAAPADRDFLTDLLLTGLQELTDASFLRLAQRLEVLVLSATASVTASVSATATASASATATASASATAPVPALPPAPAASELPPFELHRELEALLEARLGLLHDQVYARFLAYARGALRGGQVDAFFTRRLPRLELSLEAIDQALRAEGLEPQRELWDPLEAWYIGTMAAAQDLFSRRRHDLLLERLELEQRLLGPVLTLRRGILAASSQGQQQGQDGQR